MGLSRFFPLYTIAEMKNIVPRTYLIEVCYIEVPLSCATVSFLQSVMHTIGFNLDTALSNKEHGFAIIYAKTAMPWSLDCKFLVMRLRMTEQ